VLAIVVDGIDAEIAGDLTREQALEVLEGLGEGAELKFRPEGESGPET